MIGKQLKSLRSLLQIQQFCFSTKRTIIDLKKYREQQLTSRTSSSSHPQNITTNHQNKTKVEQQVEKHEAQQEISKNIASNDINMNKNKPNISNTSPEETKSRQLSSNILKCSTEKELMRIFYKSPIPLESQHHAMILYKFFKLRKIQSIFSMHSKRLQKTQDGTSANVEEKEMLWENKKFIQVYEKVIINLENMNPDSLNLLIKSLGMRRSAGGNHPMALQLFENIIELLKQDSNILLFNEYQLFCFVTHLKSLKNYVGQNQSCQKIIQQAQGKLAPHLMSFKRSQLLNLTIVSLYLGLYENNFHIKLNQAVLKRYLYLTQTDFTLLFQYNTLYYQQYSSKHTTREREEEKHEIFNRILNHIEKRDILRDTNFKNLMKFCAYIYKLDLKLEKENIFITKLNLHMNNRFSEYIDEAISNKRGCKSHPILLNDSFNFMLTHPQIYNQNKQFFAYLRKYITQVEDIEFENYLHVSHFLIECLSRKENITDSSLPSSIDLSLQQNNVLISTLNQTLSKLNANFNKVEAENLEEILELISKIECNEELKSVLHGEDISKILLKCTKYICQINYKLSTPVLIKIAMMMKQHLIASEEATLRFFKYLKRYCFSEYFNKYEDVVKMQEVKAYFKSIDDPISLDNLVLENQPEKSIDDLDFSEDLEKVQEQIYQQASKKQEELMKVKSKQEEVKKMFPPLQIPSLQALQNNKEKYQHCTTYIDVFRRQTHIINSILLSQIVFSDDSLKLQQINIWKESSSVLSQMLVPQLLTIDNINTIIFIKQLYKLNEMEYLSKETSIDQLCDIRIQSLVKQFETRKKPSRQKAINSIESKYTQKIKQIEEGVLFENCLIDLVITTNNGDRIAVIAASKVYDPSENGKAFNCREENIKHVTQLRQQFLKQSGFSQVHATDNKDLSALIQL